MFRFALFLLPMIIVCSIFVTVAIAHLYVRNQVLKYSYLVPMENKKQKMLMDENKTLKSQFSVLASPGRIEKVAVERLNMRYPDSRDIIKVEEGFIKNYIGQSE